MQPVRLLPSSEWDFSNNVQKFIFTKVWGQTRFNHTWVPLVLAQQEGRLNFYLAMGWFMFGELPQLPPSPFGHKHLVLLSVLGLCLGRGSCSPLLGGDSIFKQPEPIRLNQATNWFWPYFCTLLVHTEDKFPPCIFHPCKMCSTGHFFTTSVLILICLVFTDRFSLPALLGPATFSSCLLSFDLFPNLISSLI